jgi:uncharacterized protein
LAALYVDTSVLGRVLLDEPDAAMIARELEQSERLVASRLLRVELLRLGRRSNVVEAAHELLTTITLLPLDEEIVAAAENVRPDTVATLEAIHLVTALRVAEGGDLEALVTYDAQLAAGAAHHGLRVVAPR